jgi:hypothetical protein
LPQADTNVTFKAIHATEQIEITFVNTVTWCSEVGAALTVFESPPCSIATNFFNGPWRYIGRILGAAVPPVSPVNIGSYFSLGAGQKIFCKFRLVRADGRATTFFGQASRITE